MKDKRGHSLEAQWNRNAFHAEEQGHPILAFIFRNEAFLAKQLQEEQEHAKANHRQEDVGPGEVPRKEDVKVIGIRDWEDVLSRFPVYSTTEHKT